MNIQTLLGKNIRIHREARAWSQDDLSEYSGLHRTYISGVERGVRNPTIKVVDRLAMALGVDATELLRGAVSAHGSRKK